MKKEYYSIKTALQQIEKCSFKCEAGSLSSNTAYQWLVAAAKIGPEFWPGQGVFFEVTATVAGVKLSKWMHYYIVGCSMESDNERRFWTYSLSSDPPGPWHGGKVHHRGVHGDLLRLEAPVAA